MNSARMKVDWPNWTPSHLIDVYDHLENKGANVGKKRNFADIVMDVITDRIRHEEYLDGLGKKRECQQLVRKLGTDNRMKSVWSTLDKIEKDIRSGKTRKYSQLQGTREKESVVSMILLYCCSNALDSKAELLIDASKTKWRKHHEKIGKIASELASLLKQHRYIVDEGLSKLVYYFPAEVLEDIAGDMYFHFGLDGPDVDMSRLNEPGYLDGLFSEPVEESQEEIDKQNNEFKENVKPWIRSLRNEIEDHSMDMSNILGQLSKYAIIAAKKPPFLPPKKQKERIAFNLEGALVMYFGRMLGRPLYDVISTIIEVVTEKQTSPDAVKMRWDRFKKNADKKLK
ncbi:MAG: hypothetical protein ABUS47_15350 [Steroidobacter sp.]